VPTPEEITRHHDASPPDGLSPWVGDHRPRRDIRVVDPDPSWPGRFATLAGRVRTALGDGVLAIDHVGSTSVAGLPAKPIIDIDLIVADPADEAAYVPALERVGFTLVVREPWWQEHRCLLHDDPKCNLHVFPPDAAEPVRHRMFRDWLLAHPDDRALYRDTKHAAATAANEAGEHVMQYNARKQQVIREIYARAFAAAGLLG
jgi:GrpB-like predicted nucleotidyltransferase (UPF0157 family)